MNAFKNFLIAILTGLLVLTLSTQTSSGAGSSAAAKTVEYDHCLTAWLKMPNTNVFAMDEYIKQCAKYKP